MPLTRLGRPMPPGEMLGLAMAIVGGIMDNTGVSMQKLAMTAGPYWTRPRWICGLVLYLIGTVLNGIGLGLAPASMVALLSPFVLIYNVVNAVLVLGEKLTWRILSGTLVIIVGSAIAIASGSRSREPNLFRVEDFVARLLAPPFIAYFVALSAFMVLLTAGAYRYRYPERSSGSEHLVLDESLSDDESLSAPSRQAFDTVWRQAPFVISPTIAFPVLTGCLASLTTLTWKSCIELLKSSMHGYPAFRYLWTYVLASAVMVLGSAQVYMLNTSMRYCKQLSMIPALVVTNEILSIVGGGVFFNEMADFSFGQAMEFISAIMVIITGIYLVSTGQFREQNKLFPDGSIEVAALEPGETELKPTAHQNDPDERQSLPLMFDVPLA